MLSGGNFESVPTWLEEETTMASPIFTLELDSDQEIDDGNDAEWRKEESSSEPPPPKVARFALNSFDRDDVAKLIDQRVPASTKRTTNQWLKMFESYCADAKLSVNLLEDSPEKICEALALCYVNCTGQNGQPYQRPSLMGLRAALHTGMKSINMEGAHFGDNCQIHLHLWLVTVHTKSIGSPPGKSAWAREDV